jgi:hypothetical protein
MQYDFASGNFASGNPGIRGENFSGTEIRYKDEAVPKLQFLEQLLTPGENCLHLILYTVRNWQFSLRACFKTNRVLEQAQIQTSFLRCLIIFFCESAGYTLACMALQFYAEGALEWALCSVAAGALSGLGAVFYFPNYPPWRALCAGVLGGMLGILPVISAVNFIKRAAEQNFSELYYRPDLSSGALILLTGAWAVLCGFIVSLAEETSREAWLTIVWKTGGKTSVALGKKPVSFGSSKKALIRLPRYSFDQSAPAISAVFTREYDGRIFVRDCLTETLEQLGNGSRIDFGGLSAVVHTADAK